jgi:hypothetical protein
MLADKDRKDLDALSRAEVKQCLTDLLGTYERFGYLEESELYNFQVRFKQITSSGLDPEVKEIKNGCLLVEWAGVHVELKNGEIIWHAIEN